MVAPVEVGSTWLPLEARYTGTIQPRVQPSWTLQVIGANYMIDDRIGKSG